nr:uncharacterized protein LOC129164886 [Nothobranchius furzeri]
MFFLLGRGSTGGSRRDQSLVLFCLPFICYLWGQSFVNMAYHSISMLTIARFTLHCVRRKVCSIQSFVSCINEVKSWLMANVLHLNEGKTELIVFHPNSRNVDRYVDLGPLSPYSKPVVTSLGVKIDAGLKFDAHINSVIQSSFFHLRRLANIKPILSRAHLERVLHAFVISRLDYCNSLYSGLCQSSLRRLQVVQNSAARFLTGTRKRDHISPVLASLHWLPVCYRAQFKILVFVYNFFQGGGS